MKAYVEKTEWSGNTPNHVYFLNNSKDRAYGYVPAATGQAVRFRKPISFETKGRKFLEVTNTWNFTVEESVPSEKTWSVKGSAGNEYIVTQRNGKLMCSCAGFKYRGTCKHIKEVV